MTAVLFCIALSIIVIGLTLRKNVEFPHIILLGFLLRVFILIVDRTRIYPGLLHASGDAEGFHKYAIKNSLSAMHYQYTNYTDFLTPIYYVFQGDNPRLVGQFVNILFGMGVIFLIGRCLRMLDVPYRVRKIVILLAALTPNVAILSGLLIREAWIHYFVALSVYFFLRWFLQKGGSVNILLTFFAVFAAMAMHAGVIGLAIGYSLAFILYKPALGKVKVTVMSLVPLFFIALCVLFFILNLDTLGQKFSGVLEQDDYVEENLTHIGYEGGGSDYLQWIDVSSLSLSMAFLPLRMFYFLFSPIPIDWRGIGDMIAFAMDGLMYMWLFWHIFKSSHLSPAFHFLRKFLATGILVVVIIFAIGTRNSGTAMRHRAKILPVVLVTYAVTQHLRQERKNEKNKSLPTS